MDKAKGAPGNQYTGKLNPSLYLRDPKAARTIRAFERGDETGLPPRDRPMDCLLFPEMHAVLVHADDGRVGANMHRRPSKNLPVLPPHRPPPRVARSEAKTGRGLNNSRLTLAGRT